MRHLGGEFVNVDLGSKVGTHKVVARERRQTNSPGTETYGWMYGTYGRPYCT
jgi:hypothetical protein